MYTKIQNGNELYHHGIKGMKWGIRRFQNKNGTRTPAGKKRELSARKKEKLDKKYTRYVNRAADDAHRKKDQMDRYLASQGVFLKYPSKEAAIKERIDLVKSEKYYKKAENLSKKYEMTKWSDAVKKQKKYENVNYWISGEYKKDSK